MRSRSNDARSRMKRAARAVTLGATAAMVCSASALAASSLPTTGGSFDSGLRRTILIEGQEDTRFSLAARMDHYRVPGVSVAIVDGCRIVDSRGFGTSAGSSRPITPDTLFQAGSISKTLTAVAALKLVEEHKLQLDAEVRPRLAGWASDRSPAGPDAPVTLRRLLDHTAGLNEIGGKGYARGEPLPTLTQIINGAPPANTPPIRIETTPGTKWAYSSGGYYLIQALMTAATGKSFVTLVDELVFGPAQMRVSTFAQPLDEERSRMAADAAGADGAPMRGGWRVNPELAAGGLWTTPSDLARFLITLTHDIRGDSERLLGRGSARQMMTPGMAHWGLGVELGNPHGPRRFGHTGHTVGFASEYVMYPDTCQGAVVMTNGDEGGWLITEILRAIGDAYHWPEPRASTVQAAIPLTETIARRFVGTYHLRDFPTEEFTVSRKADGGLYWARKGHVGRDLLPEQSARLFSPDSRMTLDAVDPTADRAASLELGFGGGKNIADRIEAAGDVGSR